MILGFVSYLDVICRGRWGNEKDGGSRDCKEKSKGMRVRAQLRSQVMKENPLMKALYIYHKDPLMDLYF